MFNSVKKYMFGKSLERVRTEIKEAWKDMTKADEYLLSGEKKGTVFVRGATDGLLEAYKRLQAATLYMPKNDISTKMLFFELILEYGDPMMYDYIYPGFRDAY